ncbi:hypothetical protein CVO_02455 [Sulfurimonas sp. CVO]|uniref:hypothetical protein n=1 Tax=Sulfurimonas sp. CVO TaxID=2283483 RepID=UPI00132EB3FC|nr:hypothetical protein [Sulfurimonas sp. CVO]QHG90768.1 hypothetical protein CVO_02455 [Sulfurimonas sp. CVO]
MNDTLLIQLLKIIKQSKQPIIKAFEDDSSRASFVDFDTVLEDIQKHTKSLSNSIKKEAKTFNSNYESEEQMMKAVINSFKSINLELKELITIYKDLKSNISSDNIQALLSLQISKKVLYDYIIWCEKLENALICISKDEAIFIPNIEIESEIISFIADNTKSSELNFWLPFFSGLGLGFLLDD